MQKPLLKQSAMFSTYLLESEYCSNPNCEDCLGARLENEIYICALQIDRAIQRFHIDQAFSGLYCPELSN